MACPLGALGKERDHTVQPRKHVPGEARKRAGGKPVRGPVSETIAANHSEANR